jgi:hypothetical protein
MFCNKIFSTKNRNLNAENDFVFKGMRIFVSGKNDVGIFQQLVTDHITQGVILLENKKQ